MESLDLEDDTAPMVRVSAPPVEAVARPHRNLPPLPAAARPRANPVLPRAPALAPPAVAARFAPPTVGASMLQARRSRAPLVVILVLAAIASIAVGYLVF